MTWLTWLTKQGQDDHATPRVRVGWRVHAEGRLGQADRCVLVPLGVRLDGTKAPIGPAPQKTHASP
ncbi:hypothetical protein [Streptomyces sp. NPDC048191]|uniref:hypothetical protein n=1 Tax=Streptomyces sp. NPDC048191 TaxID=3155484 RepID=UPI0033C9C453